MQQDVRASRDIILRTRDWDQALAFYGSVLGLPMQRHGENLARFEAGGFVLYVERGAPHGPVHELLFADAAAARTRLLAAGCELVEEDPGVPKCYVRDPFGLVFNIGRG
jgi:catechol 2,3-dioxygenase-like lactoylglutathione lyase family enzyme